MRTLALLPLALLATSAQAWKPYTHVYLSELALTDALDDGKVTIYLVDYEAGRIVGTLGEYAAEPGMLAAIRANRPQFRAGILGPDAQPDIVTGQQVIHPDCNDAGGTKAWLRHMWDRSRNANPSVQAYVAGFLCHAAGDMFAHTYVNHFTGGEFAIGPNAARHIVLEGYLGKRTPAVVSYEANIDQCGEWIYENLVRAEPGSLLERTLLAGPTGWRSFGGQFSSLRNRLQKFLDDHPTMPAAKRIPLIPFAAYVRRWIADIDAGLRAWPETSHRVAAALMYNPSNGADIAAAEAAFAEYKNRHLLSMLGAPDILGQFAEVLGEVMDFLTPKAFLDWVAAIKNRGLDALLQLATGSNKAEWAAWAKNPENFFDRLLGAPNLSPGQDARHPISLADLNKTELQIADPGYSNPAAKFDWRTFRPAFNTVTMTKLLLMAPSEVDRMLADLGSQTRLRAPNAMLGFIRSLDSGNEWHKHPEHLVAIDAGVYQNLFMRQQGDETPAVTGPIRLAELLGDYEGPDGAKLTLKLENGTLQAATGSREGWGLAQPYEPQKGVLDIVRTATAADLDPQIPEWARRRVEADQKLVWRLALTAKRVQDGGQTRVVLEGTFYPGKVTLTGPADANGAFAESGTRIEVANGPEEKEYARQITYSKAKGP